MHTVTLQFSLPRDQDALDDALRGAEYLSALRELAEWLRSERKYRDTIHAAEDELHRILDERGIDLY